MEINNQAKINLDSFEDVPKTLLIPLYGRAYESQKVNQLLNDPKAVEIVNSINFDFDNLLKSAGPVLTGACIRTLMYDRILLELLEKYPEATIVELGCGLNTRFERIDNKKIKGFDLDVPEVMNIWSKFFIENERRITLPYSAFDPEWAKIVKVKSKPPYIFIAEASVIFFPENDIKNLFNILSENFPDSYYIFDTASKYMIKNQEKHKIFKLFSARLKWSIENVKEIESWGNFKVLKSMSFLEIPDEIKNKLPLSYRIFLNLANVFLKTYLNTYKINLIHIL